MKINKEDTIEVGKTHNGYLLKTYFSDSDTKGDKIIESDLEVFEFSNDEQEKEKIIQLLYKIAENLGITYNKYGENNLDIKFGKKGSKVE